MNAIKNYTLKIAAPMLGLLALMTACGGSSAGTPALGPGLPGTPVNVQAVAGDGDSTEPQNTISWTLAPNVTEYRVYWANTPGVSKASSVLVPPQQPARYVTHTGVDVVAGTSYYYRVEAITAGRASPLSVEVEATPQATITTRSLNDVAWNGDDTLVAVGDSGTILRSPNGLKDGWTDASTAIAPQSLSAVAWDGVNNQFTIVGAGSTVLTGDGNNWIREDLSNFIGALNLNDVQWLGSRYIAVGNNGVILLSNTDGSQWAAQNPGVDAATQSFNAVASNGVDVVIAVGTNGAILASDTGVVWDVVPSSTNNDLNDATWDGSQFVVVGSNDTVLSSRDGMEWTPHTPGTSDINFVAVSHWDAGALPANPVLATVGSAGTYAIDPDADPGRIVRTGTTEQLGGMTWVDDGATPGYFVIVGNDGTVLTTLAN